MVKRMEERRNVAGETTGGGRQGPIDPRVAFGMTDIGRKRETNQDQFLIAQLNKSMLVTTTSLPLDQKSRLFGGVQGQLLVVADGMGGHAAGERASSLAIDQLIGRLLNNVHWFFQVDHDCEDDFVDDLKDLLQDAHTRILSEAVRDSRLGGMGTTLTMAHVVWPRLYVVHAGDSRCYLVRDGVAEQLTTDHTLAHKLVESGGMTAEDEATSRWSHVLWNVLGGGGEGTLLAEVRRADLRPGDVIVLCSDGLHRYVDGETLARVVGEQEDLETTCGRLVRMANDAGGADNITVVVSRPLGERGRSLGTTVQAEVPLGRLLDGERSKATEPGSQRPYGEGDDALFDTLPG